MESNNDIKLIYQLEEAFSIKSDDDRINIIKNIIWKKISKTDYRILLIYLEKKSYRSTAKYIGINYCIVFYVINKIRNIVKIELREIENNFNNKIIK